MHKRTTTANNTRTSLTETIDIIDLGWFGSY